MKFAKNRLNKFYNPKMYKAPPKQELSAEDRIAGTGIAVLAQITAHVQQQHKDAPPPPPETFGPYTKKSEESNGVMAMIDLLIKDLDKEMTEAETAEKDAQADYEALMKDSAEKRTKDSKSLTEEEAAAEKELGATMQYIASLHAECDWLLKYFDM